VALACVRRLGSRTALVNKNSLFLHVPSVKLSMDGVACSEQERLVFECGEKYVEAARVSGLYGSHLCLTASAGERLTLRISGPAPSAIEGSYDVSRGHGSVRVSADGQELVKIKARPVDQGLQFLRFDLRELDHRPTDLEVEIQGSALHCFDFSAVP
jgi:hypothetical protein